MTPALQQAMRTLHQTGRLRLEGAPAVWSKSMLVLLKVTMGLVILVAVGGFIAVVSVTIFVENPPWGGMVFGYIMCLGMMTVLFFLIRYALRRQERHRETE